MGNTRTVAIALLLALLGVSCASLTRPSPKIEYYSLEYAPPSLHRPPLPTVIQVKRFGAAPLYDTRQMVYREKPFSRNSYVYHRWRSTPADLVGYFLTRDLKASGLFAGVLPHDSRHDALFSLEGSVDDFLESGADDGWEAVLAFGVTLSAAREPDPSRRVLFQKTYRAKRPCARKHPRAVAEAMSQAMAELSAEVLKDVYGVLERRTEVGKGERPVSR